MALGSVGAPELIVVLVTFVFPLLLAAAFFAVLYFVVKSAVRNGIRESRKDGAKSQNRVSDQDETGD